MLRGVNRYVRQHPGVQLVNFPIANATDLKLLPKEKLDGMVLNTYFANAPRLQQLGLPVVNVSTTHRGLPYKLVATDDGDIGRVAATHLLQKGFRVFAFVGGAHAWSDQRLAGFTDTAERALRGRATVHRWTTGDEDLATWLTKLPKPVGLMTANDAMATDVLLACRASGIDVPRQIAVVGVDDDELYCEVVSPPLTSIGQQTERIGFLAADALVKLINGKTVPAITLVAPGALVPRASTDAVAVDDALVERAVRLMQSQLSTGTNVKHVAAKLDVSRRALELRFRAAIGHTPGKHLLGLKVDHARLLLASTDLPIGEIARLAGFGPPIRMSQSFRRMTGQSPTQYRAQFRL